LTNGVFYGIIDYKIEMGEIMDIVYEMEESLKGLVKKLAENDAREREMECMRQIFKPTDNEKILSKLDEILDEIRMIRKPMYRCIPWYDFYVPPYTPSWQITCGVDWGVNDCCDTHACLGEYAYT